MVTLATGPNPPCNVHTNHARGNAAQYLQPPPSSIGPSARASMHAASLVQLYHEADAQSSSMYGRSYSSNSMLSARWASQGRMALPGETGLERAGGFDAWASDSGASMHMTGDCTVKYDCPPPSAKYSTILKGCLTRYSVE